MSTKQNENLPALRQEQEILVNWPKIKEVGKYFASSSIIAYLALFFFLGLQIPGYFLTFLIFVSSGLVALSLPKPKKILSLEQKVRDNYTNESLIEQQNKLDKEIFILEERIESMYENDFLALVEGETGNEKLWPESESTENNLSKIANKYKNGGTKEPSIRRGLLSSEKKLKNKTNFITL